jgi:hypothetical protein
MGRSVSLATGSSAFFIFSGLIIRSRATITAVKDGASFKDLSGQIGYRKAKGSPETALWIAANWISLSKTVAILSRFPKNIMHQLPAIFLADLYFFRFSPRFFALTYAGR